MVFDVSSKQPVADASQFGNGVNTSMNALSLLLQKCGVLRQILNTSFDRVYQCLQEFRSVCQERKSCIWSTHPYSLLVVSEKPHECGSTLLTRGNVEDISHVYARS